tara:strand:- start:98 stop:319 length:222 start_codon:yes stop_codon:yes gene_type:complete
MTIFQRIIFFIFFNSSLFILLVVGLQNNLKKSKVNFIVNETVDLPIGFVCGASFISGSITGSFLSFKFKNKKN